MSPSNSATRCNACGCPITDFMVGHVCVRTEADKIKVESIIRLKPYGVIKGAVDDGAMCGMHRAYKYQDEAPGDDEIKRLVEHVVEGVMNELCEILDFGDE